MRTFTSRLLIQSVVLALGVATGMPAQAQTFNGVEIPLNELGVVLNHCETIIAHEVADNSDFSGLGGTDGSSTSYQELGETGISGMNISIDLDQVDVAACKEIMAEAR